MRNSWRAAAPALLVGCGFFAAFGWVWFAGVFVRVIADSPEVFSGTLFSGGGVSAFSAALFAGFVLNVRLARRLAKRDQRIVAPLLHGGALVCMAGGLFAREASPPLSAALLGLAASGPGVYWTTRLLGLPAPLAGFALACAALLSCVLSPAVLALGSAAFLPAGIVLAMGLAMAPVKDGGAALKTGTQGGPGKTLSDEALSIALLASSFFASGVLTAAAPLSSAANLPAAAGIVAAAACCARVRGGARGIPLLTGGAVLLTSFQLVLFPGMDGAFSFLGGFWEGAALAGLAALKSADAAGEKPGILPADFSRAALCLAAIFGLVNLGGAAGSAVMRAGDTGGWLFAIVFAAFCPAALWLFARRHRPRGQSAPSEPEQPAKLRDSAAVESTSPSPSPTPWSRLTRRECEVSELLIQEKSNLEICAALFVSENTVRTHIKNIYHKTGAASREELKKLLRENR